MLLFVCFFLVVVLFLCVLFLFNLLVPQDSKTWIIKKSLDLKESRPNNRAV